MALAIIVLSFLAGSFLNTVAAEAPEPVIEIPEKIKDDPLKSFAYREIYLHWGESEWDAFNKIVSKESMNWTVHDEHYKGNVATLPNGRVVKSSAYGLGGFMDGTWAMTGYEKTNDPYIQVKATIIYIEKSYKTPTEAWKKHQSRCGTINGCWY